MSDIYEYACVFVCPCVYVSERERERERECMCVCGKDILYKQVQIYNLQFTNLDEHVISCFFTNYILIMIFECVLFMLRYPLFIFRKYSISINRVRRGPWL